MQSIRQQPGRHCQIGRCILGGTVVLNKHIYESRLTNECGVRNAELSCVATAATNVQ